MSESIVTFRLKPGHAKPLYAGHPWVFADAIDAVDGDPEAGDEVRVIDHRDQALGHGYYSPTSAIPIRLLTRGDEEAGEALLEKRIDAAILLRKDTLKLGGTETNAYRLIYGEGDGLGGLVADVYNDILAVQIHSAGMDKRRDVILSLIQKRMPFRTILDRSDTRLRKLEGLEPAVIPDSLPEAFEVTENGIRYLLDFAGGAQKTGFFVDQRENRRRFGEFAKGRDVLDLFAYSGAFALNAQRGGAKSLTLVDSSHPALEMARVNLELNKIEDADLIESEWAEALRHLRTENRLFDLVVIDPPKFARAKKDIVSALAGYKDLNAQAVRMVRPGGIMFTCSCSGNVDFTEFERSVAFGIAQAGRRATLLESRGAGPDHPVWPGFDQGRYLKCLILRVE